MYEILCSIAYHLNYLDLLKFSLVNKVANQVFNNHISYTLCNDKGDIPDIVKKHKINNWICKFTDIEYITNNFNISGITLCTFSDKVHLLNGLDYVKVYYNRDIKSLTNVKCLDLGLSKITELPIFDNIYELVLKGNDVFINSNFSKVKILNLSMCNITGDLIHLNNAISINFKCSNVKDVNMLDNVKILNLRYCKITDVSNLKSATELDLSFTDVLTVCNLPNLNSLNISNTFVSNIIKLDNLSTINVSNTYITSLLGLNNLINVNISRSLIKDLSYLSKLQSIIVYYKDYYTELPKHCLDGTYFNDIKISNSRILYYCHKGDIILMDNHIKRITFN
jgi:hypothetical protein